MHKGWFYYSSVGLASRRQTQVTVSNSLNSWNAPFPAYRGKRVLSACRPGNARDDWVKCTL